jgi:hypothetical protein
MPNRCLKLSTPKRHQMRRIGATALTPRLARFRLAHRGTTRRTLRIQKLFLDYATSWNAFITISMMIGRE